MRMCKDVRKYKSGREMDPIGTPVGYKVKYKLLFT